MDEKLLDVFHRNKEVAFTTAVDGKPHVRIFQIMKIDADNNSIYFATSPHKEVYSQLKQNPNVAILDLKGAEFARVNGTIDFDVPDEVQREIFETNPVLHTSTRRIKIWYICAYRQSRPTILTCAPILPHLFIMTSEKDRLDTLLRALLKERPEYARISIPDGIEGKRNLLRSLMNVRMPAPLPDDIMELQDEELSEQRREKGVVTLESITASPLYPRLRLWQGDITRLQVDAIVNAANSQMLGCFIPLHRCIDNAIHSAAGMQLREECASIMHAQGHEEPTGKAKITRGYNLPAKWVIHTVGPIVYGAYPTDEDSLLLADCYRNCLKLADEKKLKSVAFCCISTGEFHFPQDRAAQIAVATVREYLDNHSDTTLEAVVFNVFKDKDYYLYKDLLGYE